MTNQARKNELKKFNHALGSYRDSFGKFEQLEDSRKSHITNKLLEIESLSSVVIEYSSRDCRHGAN